MRRIALLWALVLVMAGAAEAQRALPGEYVVRRADRGVIQEKDLAAVKAYGVHGLEVFAHYPRVLGVRADRRTADLLAAQGLQVEPNYVFQVAADSFAGWQDGRVAQRTPWNPSSRPVIDPRTSGTIFLLDTFAYDPADELGDRLVRGPDFVGTDDRDAICRTHGTWTADLAAGKTLGLTPQVRVVSLRIVTCEYSVSSVATYAALDWLVDEGIRRYGPGSVNMSWGAFDFTRNPYAKEFKALREAGVVLVAAAMNSGEDASTVMPCAWADLCVGSSNVKDSRSSFSDYGPAVHLFAPGEDVTVIGPDGVVSKVSGTSSSTPLVAATLLLLKGRFPQLPFFRLADLLLANSTQGALQGDLGAGSPNRLLFVGPVTETVAAGDVQYSRRKKRLTASVQIALNGQATLSQWIDFYRGARGANGKCKGKRAARGLIDATGAATISVSGAAANQICLTTELGGVFAQPVEAVP
jgi:hypothetical protein